MEGKEGKVDFASLKEKVLGKSGKEYWRSVEEYVDTPEFEEFVKSEYPAHAEEWDNSLNRRKFLKVMGASLAFAGLTGCVVQPTENIIPYHTQPEDLIPGKPLYFATSMTLSGNSTGLLAKSNEGRPTKIEGNPEHPGSLGATDVLAQASILNLYDPDRSQEVRFRGTSKSWQSAAKIISDIAEKHRSTGGQRLRFLTETVVSPSLRNQFAALLTEFPNSKWVQYEPVNRDNAYEGAKIAFGNPVETIYRFDEADRILSIDADLFSGFNVRYLKDFAKKRRYHSDEKNEINRLYAIETSAGLTGAKADHRLSVKPSEVLEIVKAIAVAIGVGGASSTYKKNEKWISEMASDLKSSAGRSVVVVGGQHSPEIHALVHAINSSLDANGKTVFYTQPSVSNAETTQTEQLRQLIAEIDAGQVETLVILGGNPVYNTPADLKLNKARMDRIADRIHLGEYFDETGEICQWHVHAKHFLEGWSDTRTFDGTAAITQPLIAPLYDGKSAHEVIQLFLSDAAGKLELDIVKDYWKSQNLLTTEDAWRKAVHDGFIEGTKSAEVTVSLNGASVAERVAGAKNSSASGALEFAILPDPAVYDGRFANNGWLQELPKPLSKTTWENVAFISPKTAKELGLNQSGRDAKELAGGAQGTSFINTMGGNLLSDGVKVKVNGLEIGSDVPVWIQPGQPDGVISLFMGYGRKRAGRVGTGLGYNVFDIRTSKNANFGAIEIVKTGRTMTVASTQTHFNIQGRDKQILQVFDVAAFSADPTLGKQNDYKNLSMYPSEEYDKMYAENHKWGMAIDLNSCVGCNACVIACQSENNIPVVGKEQIERSREMHWIRIDAYYKGDVDNPQGPHFQPMLCQQCELAPCEPVCPVHATVHSAEGLNDMVYNRCVGTRYCSNNCPYKVRRFNFMLYQDWDTPQYKLMRNPEVTVRSRGVMEKCTYCTQRISFARIEAAKENRKVRDGEILTACQSACPTDAIVFGDLNDKEAEVFKKKTDKRNFTVLYDLNTQPRTTYLAGLRNQNTKMPDYVAPKEKGAKAGDGGH